MPLFDTQWLEPAAAGTPARVRRTRVQAGDAQAVAAVLGVPAARLLQVRPVGLAAPGWLARPLRSGSGPRLQLRLFSQELAVLLEAGIPLLEALQTLREKDGDAGSASPLDVVLAALRDGQPVSAALARAPRDFDALFIALVASSERNGQLVPTLRDHAAYLAWAQALAGQLRAALVYPLLLLTAGGAVILFLLLYVLPRFAGVFDGLGRDLPAASRWLIDLGQLAGAHPAATIALALSGPAGALLASRSTRLRQAAQAALWRSPGLGPRLRLVALARLYRALSLTLAAGVPAPAALALVAGVLPPPLRPPLAQALAQVRSGQRLSAALQDQGLATPVARRMLRVGESSGELAAMLQRAAGFHDEQIARLSDLVSRLVNPVLMLVMGVVIGGIVVLMYLPIFTLMEQVQ
jgi:general secretion pathway protein F